MSDIDASAAKQQMSPSDGDGECEDFEENHSREQKMFLLEANRAMLSKQLSNNKKLMALRTNWSWGLLVCVMGIVFLNFLFMFLVGLGVLDFPNAYMFPTFIGQGILQIAAMGYVVVQFLFHEKSFDVN